MCDFFSCVTKGDGKLFYFVVEQRKLIREGKLFVNDNIVESQDSHTSICSFFNLNDDKVNKYEYNPLTKKFVIDQLNTNDDSKLVEKSCNELDFKTIVPELNIKPIVNALKIERKKNTVNKREIKLLKNWASVRDSVRASVRDSVRASVRDSVWASVWASVRDSVGASVWASVRDSVGDSVWASVRDSVWTYIGGFFKLPEWKYVKTENGKYPFQCLLDLWEVGLVPSFDGITWRLHAGEKATIVFEISKEELEKV